MKLYAGTTDQFRADARMHRIAAKLRAEYTTQIGHRPAPSEVASWQNSLMALSMLVDQAELNDHSVIGEYQLANTSRRLDAMLTLSRWLDDGGVAGMLADRTLPGTSARSRAHVLEFLGAPAVFGDGPFRLAAMLRRKVVFMAGLHRGGNRYELRFAELADFSSVAAGGRDAAIRGALERYVATLETLCREAPYNWFNFYDFWAHDDAAPPDRAE